MDVLLIAKKLRTGTKKYTRKRKSRASGTALNKNKDNRSSSSTDSDDEINQSSSDTDREVSSKSAKPSHSSTPHGESQQRHRTSRSSKSV